MKQKGSTLKRFLYKNLSFENYLSALSKIYFLSFNLGLLKRKKVYAYPYFLDRIIKKGMTCIDIGANLGYITVVLAKLVGKDGQVFAVEPVKPVFNVLTKNTRKYPQVTRYPFALGQENKMISLGNNTAIKQGYAGSGSHFILDKEVTAETTADIEFQAEMKRGSELFADLEKLDFIKMDIEGFEIVVIPEIKGILTKLKPMVLIEAQGENRAKIIDFFTEINYDAFELENNKLKQVDREGFWDILFIPQSKRSRVQEHINL